MPILSLRSSVTGVFLALAGLWGATAHAQADGTQVNAQTDNPFDLIEAQPISELWLNPGFYSYHWQRDLGLEDGNPGFGAEYRFSTVASVTAGEYYNSNRTDSKYIGVYYQPVEIGPVRLGAAIGGFNGYPNMKGGGWFLAGIPVASYEYKRVGLNFAIVPAYKDRLYGALSFQFKLKVY